METKNIDSFQESHENTKSNRGKSGEIFKTICQPIICKILSDRTLHFYFTDSKQDTFTKTIKTLSKDSPSLIVSCGGEGTNNDVLNAVMHFYQNSSTLPIAMSVLPLGSCNDFAKSIGFVSSKSIEQHYETLIEFIAKGATISIDFGKVLATSTENHSTLQTCRYFLNVASFGISSAIADNFNQSKWLIRISKNWTVFLFTIWQQFVYKNKVIEMEFMDQHNQLISKETYLQQVTAIGNGKYFANGMPILPKASIQDSQLDCCIVGDVGLRDIGVLFAMKKGTHDQSDKVLFKTCSKVHVKCQERVSIEVDGDLCGMLPATFEIIPNGLPFIINDEYDC